MYRNEQTANSQRASTQVSVVYCLQKAKANKSSATCFYDNANKNSLNSNHAMYVSRLILHSCLRLRAPFTQVIPG